LTKSHHEEGHAEKHAWQKKYMSEIRRTEDLESKVSFFESLIGEVKETQPDFECDLEIKRDYEYGIDDKLFQMDELESDLEKKQIELKTLKSGLQKLYSQKARSQEYLEVINNTTDVSVDPETVGEGLRYVVGVIPNHDLAAFQMSCIVKREEI
jgi:hypothetical protein